MSHPLIEKLASSTAMIAVIPETAGPKTDWKRLVRFAHENGYKVCYVSDSSPPGNNGYSAVILAEHPHVVLCAHGGAYKTKTPGVGDRGAFGQTTEKFHLCLTCQERADRDSVNCNCHGPSL